MVGSSNTSSSVSQGGNVYYRIRIATPELELEKKLRSKRIQRLSVATGFLYVVMVIITLTSPEYVALFRNEAWKFKKDGLAPNGENALEKNDFRATIMAPALACMIITLCVMACGFFGARQDSRSLVICFAGCNSCCAVCTLGEVVAYFLSIAINKPLSCSQVEYHGFSPVSCYFSEILATCILALYFFNAYEGSKLYDLISPTVTYSINDLNRNEQFYLHGDNIQSDGNAGNMTNDRPTYYRNSNVEDHGMYNVRQTEIQNQRLDSNLQNKTSTDLSGTYNQENLVTNDEQSWNQNSRRDSVLSGNNFHIERGEVKADLKSDSRVEVVAPLMSSKVAEIKDSSRNVTPDELVRDVEVVEPLNNNEDPSLFELESGARTVAEDQVVLT